MIIGGVSTDYAQRVLDLENKDLLQKRNSERRSEQIPEMTSFVNNKKSNEDISTYEQNKIKTNEVKKEDEITQKNSDYNEQDKIIKTKSAEQSYNQGLISQTLSLSGVTADLMKTISDFKNSLPNN